MPRSRGSGDVVTIAKRAHSNGLALVDTTIVPGTSNIAFGKAGGTIATGKF